MKNYKGLWAGLGLVGLLVAVNVGAAVWLAGTFTTPAALQSVTNTTATATTGTAVPVVPGTGMTLWATCNGNSTNVTAVVVGWDVTGDNTNWTTTAPFKLTNTLNSSTAVTGYLPLTAAQLLNVQAIRQSYLSGVGATAVSNTASGWDYFQ